MLTVGLVILTVLASVGNLADTVENIATLQSLALVRGTTNITHTIAISTFNNTVTARLSLFPSARRQRLLLGLRFVEYQH